MARNRPYTRNTNFKLEPMWCNHLDFHGLVSDNFIHHNTLTDDIHNLQQESSLWSKITFGNIFQKMRSLLAHINGIQKSPHYTHSVFLHNLETTLTTDYDQLLKYEEDYWKTRSRINYLKDGEANTKFFHASTINRRRRIE